MIVIVVIFAYLGLVLIVGTVSHRFFRGTGEDYFVASRTIGPFVLLMSLFGTNMTAFSILGASGEAYHKGIGVFALMASSTAIVAPCVFFFVGTRLWAIGKQHGYFTQVQYFRERWNSGGLGLLLFVVIVALIVPYLLIGVMGGGITLHQITKGQIPQWLGGLLVCAVVFIYVCYGGVRGTAWANTFQTLVFMTLGGATFFVIVHQMGGFSAEFGAGSAGSVDSEGSHQTARTANLHLHSVIRGNVPSHIHALAHSKKCRNISLSCDVVSDLCGNRMDSKCFTRNFGKRGCAGAQGT